MMMLDRNGSFPIALPLRREQIQDFQRGGGGGGALRALKARAFSRGP